MMPLTSVLCTCLALGVSADAARACDPPVYFVVGESPAGVPVWGDSYILPLSQPADIAAARARLADPSIGSRLIVASIEAGADGINRDLLADDTRVWNWHVTAFLGFADITAEVLDSWPTYVEEHTRDFIASSDGRIGFWTYEIVAEVPAPRCDCIGEITGDDMVQFDDLLAVLSSWGDDVIPATYADVSGDGVIGFDDLVSVLGAFGMRC